MMVRRARLATRSAIAKAAIATYDVVKFGGQYSRAVSSLRDPNTWTNESRMERLQALLRHAIATVPFYRALDLPPHPELRDFPVVGKDVLKTRLEDLRSNRFRVKTLVSSMTSGSTGQPTRFYLDQAKLARRTAEVVHYNRWAGYRLGFPHTLHAVDAHKSRLRRVLQNQRLVDPTWLGGEWLDAELDRMVRERDRFYVGYASAVGLLAERALERKMTPDDFAMDGMVATAERLHDQHREAAIAAFGCPVLSRYSSRETGVLAQEGGDCLNFHLNDANYVIEFLSQNGDDPAPPGVPGRIVVTDLHNFGMPLVRYDIGDIATIASAQCACGHAGQTIASLGGREVENVWDERGKLISWVAINDAMWSHPDVDSFQFVQQGSATYEMRIACRRGSADEESIRRSLLRLVGSQATVRVRQVDSIPALNSGKRQYIVNEMARTAQQRHQ